MQTPGHPYPVTVVIVRRPVHGAVLDQLAQEVQGGHASLPREHEQAVPQPRVPEQLASGALRC